MKYFLILCILFTLAFLTRLDSFFDSKEIPGRQAFAFSTIGSGSDQDYQMHCASLYARGGDTDEAMTHYDYLFMCPLMATVFLHFSFIDGLIVIVSILLLSGCLVAIFPFLLFSSPKNISIGSILGSLILIFNPVMIEDSSGRFFIYPLVSLVYIIYVGVLWRAIRKKTLFWTNAFATVAALQSLNKPFLFVNDIPFIFLFALTLIIEKVSLIKKVPFISIQFNRKHTFKAIMLIFIYFGITIYFEIIHHIVTKQYSFLTDLFLPTNGPSTKDFVLGASLHFKGSAFQKLVNMMGLGLMGTLLTLRYTNFFSVFFVSIASLISKRKNTLYWICLSLVFTLAVSSGLYYFYIYFVKLNTYIPFPPASKINFIQISLFGLFIFLLLFKKKGIVLVGSQIFYLGALSMTLAAVSQDQLFVTLIIWICLLIAYSINDIEDIFTLFSTRVKSIALLMSLIMMFFIVWPFVDQLPNRVKIVKNEVRYLKWVATVVPPNAYIIGGASDNLLLVSKITKRTVLTNGFFVASEIKPQNMIWENTEFHPGFPQFIRDKMLDSKQDPIFYVLDHDVPKWHYYLVGGASETYPKNRYILKEVASSGYLERRIYVLANNPEYVPPIEDEKTKK